MTDRPIIFSGPMIRALLEGRKTQTRRVMKPQIIPCVTWGDPPPGTYPSNQGWSRFPYEKGDRLWVREAWRASKDYNAYPPRELSHWPVHYEADGDPDPRDDLGLNGRLRPSIHMPRWASRLTLTVTDVRVQRLGDINLGDLYAEGCTTGKDDHDRGLLPQGWQGPWGEFRDLWDSLNAKRAPWGSNPWVVALTFRVIPANIDSAEAGQ